MYTGFCLKVDPMTQTSNQFSVAKAGPKAVANRGKHDSSGYRTTKTSGPLIVFVSGADGTFSWSLLMIWALNRLAKKCEGLED